MANILVISDTHFPGEHKKALEFCRDLQEEWKCDKVIHIGDVVDHEAISFHDKNPDLPGALDEYNKTLEIVQQWYKYFPNMTICIGNHDERIFRKARSVNIPDFYLRTYNEIWKTPKWNWVYDLIVDNVYYYHGTCSGGLYPAFNKARSMGMSVVSGHTHASSGIWWSASPRHRFFGMNTGSLIDIDKENFQYGRYIARKPILSVGVVLDGIPYLEVMPCGKGEKYYKGN